MRRWRSRRRKGAADASAPPRAPQITSIWDNKLSCAPSKAQAAAQQLIAEKDPTKQKDFEGKARAACATPRPSLDLASAPPARAIARNSEAWFTATPEPSLRSAPHAVVDSQRVGAPCPCDTLRHRRAPRVSAPSWAT